MAGKYPKIECKFELSQRQKDHLGNSNELFLSDIANFLNVSIKSTRENTPFPQYRLRTSSLSSNFKVVKYLIYFNYIFLIIIKKFITLKFLFVY